MSDATVLDSRSYRPNAPMQGARALLALLGVVVLGGAIYFSFFASEADGGATGLDDWLLAAWAVANAIGFLYVAAQLGSGRPEFVRLARILIVAHLVFSVIKIFGYDEPEVVGMVVIDLLALGLLALATRNR